VSYHACDVSDEAALEQVVSTAEQRYGKIDGVIHAAGNIEPADFEWCEEMSEAKVQSILAPKVAGVENLRRLFGSGSRPVDFVWLTSSLSSVVGGLGYGAYAAANLYMDLLVESLAGQPLNWKSVCLSEMQLSAGQEKDPIAIRPEEITQLLEWSLALPGPAVVCQTVPPLAGRIDRAYAGRAAQTGHPEQPLSDKSPRSYRPALSTPYAAPATGTEEVLVGLLEEFFGIHPVGVLDNFLELGGDSLKAMVLLKKIRSEFPVTLTVRELFDSQHVRRLAAEIDDKLWITASSQTGEKKFVSII
jgi:acyl carrier protein